MRRLNEIAQARGQTLAQMALAWVLRQPAVTSALIGASKVSQIEDNVGALATWRSRRRSWPRSSACWPARRGRARDAPATLMEPPAPWELAVP